MSTNISESFLFSIVTQCPPSCLCLIFRPHICVIAHLIREVPLSLILVSIEADGGYFSLAVVIFTSV